MPLDPTTWKSPAETIADIIASKFGQFTVGVNLFIGFMPESPANAICIMDTGGGEQDSVNAIDDVSFQIYSRNVSYKIGYNIQSLIKSELQSIASLEINDEVIIGIWMKSNIAFLARDESERSLFSSNYRAKIETSKNINRI